MTLAVAVNGEDADVIVRAKRNHYLFRVRRHLVGVSAGARSTFAMRDKRGPNLKPERAGKLTRNHAFRAFLQS